MDEARAHKKLITVEPLLVLYQLASTIFRQVLSDLEYKSACFNVRLNENVCKSMKENDRAFNEIERLIIGRMPSQQSPFEVAILIVAVLIFGSYSDKHKLRKPFLLVPIVGEVLAMICCIFTVFFSPIQILFEVQTLVQIILAPFGGRMTILMAVFAYIADVSSIRVRTLQIGIAYIVLHMTNTLELALFQYSSFLTLGPIRLLIVACFLCIAAIFYTIFWIKEPNESDIIVEKSLMVDIINPKHALRTLKVLLNNLDKNRGLIAAALLVTFIYSAVNDFRFIYFYGELSVTIDMAIKLVGAIIGVLFFIKMLDIKDLAILLLTSLQNIVPRAILESAMSFGMFYIARALTMMCPLSNIVLLSIFTKVVSSKNFGKAQALACIAEDLGFRFGYLIYMRNIDYDAYNVPPFIIAYSGTILYTICIPFVLWMYCNKRADVARENPNENQNDHQMAQFRGH